MDELKASMERLDVITKELEESNKRLDAIFVKYGKDDDIYTQSIQCAGYILYCTNSDFWIEENEKGFNICVFERDIENLNALYRWKRAVNFQTELFVDVVRYSKCVKIVKDAIKTYKVNKEINCKISPSSV